MTVDKELRAAVEVTFNSQCSYCRMPKLLIYGKLEIDHIFPKERGGTDAESNLCTACRACNGHKATRTYALDPQSNTLIPLFNPRTQHWHDHFIWDTADKAIIVGITDCGRATVEALQLNELERLTFRRLMLASGWYPPKD